MTRSRPHALIRLCGATLLLLAFVCVPVTAQDEGSPGSDIVVIVSANNPLNTLDIEQLEALFLGRTQLFPTGQRALPVDQAEDSAVRERFYLEYMNRSPAQMRSYWARILFTGRGRPPRSVNSSEAVLALIASDTQAIGYIERRFLNDRVKVVRE